MYNNSASIPLGLQLLKNQKFNATPQQFAQFERGVDAILKQWTALQLVRDINNSDLLVELRFELVEWFRDVGEVFSDDLELFFEDFFEEGRNVDIEDGSIKEVADLVHQIYCECCRDEYSTIERMTANVDDERHSKVIAMSRME